MENKEFAENLLEKMKSENILPKPRWHFLLKDYVVWIFGVIALIFGAAAMSVIIYLFKYNDWEMGLSLDGGFWSFLLTTLPYFWIVFLGLFIFILYYNIKHSKKGYRYPIGFIIVFAILASIILGELFFLFGFSQKIDDVLGQKASLYTKMFNPQMDFWFQPENGRLIGLTILRDDELFIMDPSGKLWEIATSSDILSEIDLLQGQPVNLIGTISDENIFTVNAIKFHRPGRAFMSRPGEPLEGSRPNPPKNFRKDLNNH